MSDLFSPPPRPAAEPAPPKLCPHCTCARSGLYWIYDTGCAGCRARELARSMVFFNARQALPYDADYHAKRQEYRWALDDAKVTHADVMAWASPAAKAATT